MTWRLHGYPSIGVDGLAQEAGPHRLECDEDAEIGWQVGAVSSVKTELWRRPKYHLPTPQRRGAPLEAWIERGVEIRIGLPARFGKP